MFAIVSDPAKRGGRWDPGEFFDDGRNRVAGILEQIDRLGAAYGHGFALDFGCGVGRLTQALAERFDRVVGVDIAASMIERARSFNRFGDRCRYEVSARDDLAQFGDGAFDLVLADIVLQHVPPAATRRYLSEFVRVIRADGVVAFQLPTGPVSRWLRWVPPATSDAWLNRLRRWRHRLHPASVPAWESHWIPEREVRRALARAGGRLVAALPEPPIHGRIGNRLYVARRA